MNFQKIDVSSNVLVIRSVQCDGKGEKTKLFSPYHWTYRYIVLSLVCVVKTTLNYVFDAPAGIEDTIITTMQIDVTQYDLFYSVYFWPATITTFLGGILVDRFFGLRLGSLLFVAVACIGQLIFTLGSYLNSYIIMVFGRFVCGIGCDASFIVTDALASVWFEGKELTFMIAVLGFSCRLGGSLTLYLNQLIYDKLDIFNNNHTRLAFVFMIGFILSLVALVSSLTLFGADKRGERILNRLKTTHAPLRLKEFGLPFWLAAGSLISFSSCYFPFVAISQVFYMTKYPSLSIPMVTVSETVIYITSMTSPLTGFLVNFTGYNVYWGLFGLCINLTVHLFFALTGCMSYLPFIGSIMLGFSHSFFNTAMWIAPAYLVSKNQIATAFGLCSSLNNLGIATINLSSGIVIDSYGYFLQEMIFCIVALFGIVLLLLLLMSLIGENHQVNMSGRQRQQLTAKAAVKLGEQNCLYNKPQNSYSSFSH